MWCASAATLRLMNRLTYGFLYYYYIEVFKSTSQVLLLYGGFKCVDKEETVSDDENVQQEDLQIL